LRTITVPFSFSGGTVGTTDDPHQIARQEITNVVMTDQYERVMLPGYGASASRMLFESPDDLVVADFKEETISMLNTNLSNCIVQNLSVSQHAPDRTYSPEDAEATVHLDVEYKLNGDVTSSSISIGLVDPNLINVFTPF